MQTSRNTFQKNLILSAMTSMKTHLSADDIYAEVRQHYPNISRATVYRILNQLTEQGEILKLPLPQRASCYDYNTTPHYHITCLDCQKVWDIDLKILDMPDLVELNHFKIIRHHIIFEGICDECQKSVQG